MKHRRLLVAAAAAGCLTVTWMSMGGHGQDAPQEKQARAQVPGASDGQGKQTVTLKKAISMLTVAKENSHEGYDREKFDLYTDEDGDGCDARREVLIAEAKEKPKVTGDCDLTGGKWYSPFDGEVAHDARDMTIDHVVALGEAWDSGANKWPAEKLVQYGNYLKDPRHLIAVSGPSNSHKSDHDPAEWLPERDDFVCRFAADWTQVKVGWDLTADVKEKAALEALTGAKNGKCGKTPVKVP